MRITFVLSTFIICCIGFVLGRFTAYMLDVTDKYPHFAIAISICFVLSVLWLMLYSKCLAFKIEPKNQTFSTGRKIFNVFFNIVLLFIALVLFFVILPSIH